MNKIYHKECESALEYSLPDYLGDVKKILSVSASTVPSGKFASDGEVNFSGVVSYDILYADSEGKLTGLTVSSDYDLAVPVDSDSYVDSMTESRVATLAVRLTGPRKLTAKAVVSNSVIISEEESIQCSGDAFSEGNSPEVAKRTVKVEKSRFASSTEREYAEEAEHLSGVTPDEIEIIATSGAVRISESEAVEGGVRVRGELIITSIVRSAEQPPFAVKKAIPFEETINFDGLMPDMKIMADGYITSVTSGVSEDADGSVITVNAISELYCTVSENAEIEIITDAYLKNRNTNAKYEDSEYSAVVCMNTAEEVFSVSQSRGEIGCENIREILTLSADIRSFEKNTTPVGFSLSGEAAFSGAACEINEDNTPSYIPVKFSAPFSLNVNCNTQIPAGASLDVSVTAIDCDATLDAERLSVNCFVKIGYRVTDTTVINRLTECSVAGEEEYEPSLSKISVYYPEEEETLFDIAKKFHTTCAKIASDNKLDEAVMAMTCAPVSNSNVKKLIIR